MGVSSGIIARRCGKIGTVVVLLRDETKPRSLSAVLRRTRSGCCAPCLRLHLRSPSCTASSLPHQTATLSGKATFRQFRFAMGHPAHIHPQFGKKLCCALRVAGRRSVNVDKLPSFGMALPRYSQCVGKLRGGCHTVKVFGRASLVSRAAPKPL